MCNSRPVIRIGQTLDIDAQIEGDDGEIQLRWLRSRDAADIAYSLYSDISKLIESIGLAVKSVPDIDAHEVVESREDDQRLSRDRGLIIDLPNMVIESTKFRHYVRACLTVCQPGTNSKLWFRSQCSSKQTDDGWAAPIDMKFDQMESFFDEATLLSEKVLPGLRALYRNAIIAHLNEEAGVDASVDLSVANEYHFKSFDTDKDDLTRLFKQLEEQDASFTQELLKSIEQEGSPHPAVLAARLAVGRDLTGENALYHIKRSRGRYDIIGHQVSPTEPGVFVRRRDTKNGKVAREKLTFCGVTYDQEAGSREKALKMSPAFRSTAAMLASTVRNHVATSPV